MSTPKVQNSPKTFTVLPVRKLIAADTQAPEPQNLRPNFVLHWGDGPNDHIETNDTEVLVITAANPYSNVLLKDVRISKIRILKDNKKVAASADGTVSVDITPSRSIWFGDLAPGKRENREVVLMSCAALAGDYKVEIFYDSMICYDLKDCDHYLIDLVRS
ncbi:MAG: hypothetical protein AAF587_43155 [Bacteroidota bacterium]